MQVVALKFISKTKKPEKEVNSLRREIDIMKSLQHPNIVQMLDSFDTAHDVVVVTEFAQGELFQILQDDRTLPEEQVCFHLKYITFCHVAIEYFMWQGQNLVEQMCLRSAVINSVFVCTVYGWHW